MVDSLNAEIALGTVSNVDEGVRWIGYTFLFVRMRKNPMAYGIDPSTVRDDPYLGSKRNELIVLAARRLATARMIIFDEDLRTFTPTDQGRIASRYYLRNASVEVFNQTFRSNMNEADALSVISSSVEFDQITVRDSEQPELNTLAEQVIPCQVKVSTFLTFEAPAADTCYAGPTQGGPTTTQGKVNILLQSYISRAYIEDFALVSDQGYVAQNAGRIARALLDISLSKRWASTSATLISMCKSIESKPDFS
jgi:antiviral helicase SLH1